MYIYDYYSKYGYQHPWSFICSWIPYSQIPKYTKGNYIIHYPEKRFDVKFPFSMLCVYFITIG